MTRSSLLTVRVALCAIAVAGLQSLRSAEAAESTVFQTSSPYSAALDIASDMAIVYGVNDSFADRAAQWKAQGYTVGMMTGISWGGYESYYGSGADFRSEEVQTSKSGRLFMHGNSTRVGYNVPTPAYIEYIKRYVDPAIDAGVTAIFLEEPEYWAETGWSPAFQRAWLEYYGEPWADPDSSVDAQYRASRLKYELYFNALTEVIGHIKARASAAGRDIECHVPTHSLINYAHWRIVSPESHLCDIPGLDGYVAQVWTGTARTPTLYRGVRKERTFETAYLEYAQMAAMVRPTGRKVWFLADPVEDNPNRSWNDYRRNYEGTVIASLFWPETHRFEVMPWPNRIFRGAYPKTDLDTAAVDREGIPLEYATEILTVINALNDMNQPDLSFSSGTTGIGVLVSDTMMFQRAQPHASDRDLSAFHGLALPLLKNGVPVQLVQLESVLTPKALEGIRLLILSYEGQKPLKPEYHEAIALWVKAGGLLLFVETGADPYHGVRAWWNEEGTSPGKAYDDLFHRLALPAPPYGQIQPVEQGFASALAREPSQLANDENGASTLLDCVRQLLAKRGETLRVQNHLILRRGPYVIATVFDESCADTALGLGGNFVNLLDARLPVSSGLSLNPGEQALLYDLDWFRKQGRQAGVLAASARIRDEVLEDGQWQFTARGPSGTLCRARLLVPASFTGLRADPEVPVHMDLDEATGTLLLEFPNTGKAIRIIVAI